MEISPKYANRIHLTDSQKRRFTIEENVRNNKFARAIYRVCFSSPPWVKELCAFVFLAFPIMLIFILFEWPLEKVFGKRITDIITTPVFLIILSPLWFFCVMEEYDEELKLM